MYNVFKRPMFKRGGTAQGSGIMSTVEPKPVPRIMAKGVILLLLHWTIVAVQEMKLKKAAASYL
jgi:hypothetical protein